MVVLSLVFLRNLQLCFQSSPRNFKQENLKDQIGLLEDHSGSSPQVEAGRPRIGLEQEMQYMTEILVIDLIFPFHS